MRFPTAHTVLLIIAALVALLTWMIPAGQYDRLSYDAPSHQFIYSTVEEQRSYPATQETLDELNVQIPLDKFVQGDIWKPVGVPDTYHHLDPAPQGLMALLQSPIKGIMEAVDVILFVLILGGFIGVVNASGAFDAGVSWLSGRLKGREALLIIVISTLIAIGGTTFGLAEETIAFYPILMPVFLAAGYDAIVALGAIYIGSSIGTMCSTVNPFSAIIASDAAGLNWTTGLNGRLVMWLLGLLICLWYVIRYAERVRKDPSMSIIFDQKKQIETMFLHQDARTQDIQFTWNIRCILLVFMFSFVLMIYGVSRLDWWFIEMTTLFFVSAIVIGVIARMKEGDYVDHFIQGANDLLSVALIIGLARGITVLMDDGMISDTLLYYMTQVVHAMPKGLFINIMMLLYGALSFFIPSSSGMAVLTMPILAPLADVVGVGREHVVNAYQYGMGLMAFITPTGLILASLTMVKVGYDKWLRWVMPLLIILTVFTMVFLTISVYIG